MTLHNAPQWVRVEVSKENQRVHDWFPLPSAWWLLWCLCRDSYRRNLCNLCSSRLKLQSILLWKVVQHHTGICHSSLWYVGGNIYLTTDLSSQWFYCTFYLQMLLSFTVAWPSATAFSHAWALFLWSCCWTLPTAFASVLEKKHTGSTTWRLWHSSPASNPFLAHPWWTF